MDGFGTSTEDMMAAGARAMEVRDTVLADLRALQGRLAPLASAWSSDSYRVFVQLVARWDADANRLGEALGAIGEAIRTSGAGYQASEDASRDGLSTITAALG
ncbi:hypothetical protein GCM10017691_52910 [Pseudonocardia petroleophila]|uniref:WXG100 family type VII secretion target n=1 Tax=Pseudonocardia petroleophila TaxID=37331 RepID=A0A7G7MP96_9PSEU|nr:WXG100 family type VII secretion target [Pseudonocardia petroleophila]QNG54607.1 WXG100 family type VII secretion target [Pseudonocardia petroleophila]